ncbi:MAG: class I SAM-dependent methyltransferase [Ktedonobacteraceae bacterium]|nr:class I SAM-dependent methyltransferase [Ktedonobacteraceae bacterium]
MGLFERLLRRKKRPPPFVWEPTMPVLTVPLDEMDADGRRRDVPYLLPKDEQEDHRLGYQHFLLRQVLAEHCFAPVHEVLRKGGKVLDVGCGTGIWGREIARAYAQTHLIGFDLEEVPSPTPAPRNTQFVQGNLLTGFPFAAQSFDDVHQRLVVAAIPLASWPWVVGELRRVTPAGGWMELVEMGTAFHRMGPASRQFLQGWSAISASRGMDASYLSQLGLLLKHAGLSNIRAETRTIPVGKWGGRIGKLLAQAMLAGWPSMRPLAHALLGVAPEAFNEVMGRLEVEWNSYHTSYEVYVACGQVAGKK